MVGRKRSLRIAMVSPPCLKTPPDGYGGTELVVAELVDGLIDRGHEVKLFAAPGSRGGYRHRCEVENPLPQAVWPPDDAWEARYCRRATESIARDRRGFDVVHAHCPAATHFAAQLPAPLVCTIHHVREEPYSAWYARHPEVTYAAISARQRELEAPLPRAAVVHHGLEVERYPFSPGPGRFAAFLGRFSACKGLHHAIDAAADAGVRLHAAGRPHPPDLAYFEAELRSRLARPHVRDEGEADHAQKCRLLGQALATLFPIEWEEPFGLVMVESMLCGTPVVAFPRGAAAEVVEHGVTGFLVESRREMSAVLRDLKKAGTFDRAQCRARAIERFGADRMVDRYLALYFAAMEQPVRASAAAGGLNG